MDFLRHKMEVEEETMRNGITEVRKNLMEKTSTSENDMRRLVAEMEVSLHERSVATAESIAQRVVLEQVTALIVLSNIG